MDAALSTALTFSPFSALLRSGRADAALTIKVLKCHGLYAVAFEAKVAS